MKCEKCNEKEATFYYSCYLNGEKTEKHLCADCARAEGFGEVMDYRPVSALDGIFDGFFDDFFAPRRSLFSPFDVFGSTVRRMMTPVMPQLRFVIGEPQTAHAQPQSEAEAKIPEDAGAEVRASRELAALKAQLAAAVQEENFERAIELRDQIRGLEK